MQDFLLDENGDLAISNNDFVMRESTQQHQTLLLVTPKGAWKENPLVGVDAFNYLENEDRAGLSNEIRKQFTADGMTVNGIAYTTDGKLNINAAYGQ